MNTTNFSVEFINANELSAVEMLSKNLKRGASVRVTCFKETKMNKGRGKNTNPYIGRVFERTIIGGWSVGTDYDRSCQNAAERSGSNETFNGKSSWHIYYNDFFETDKATGMKYYLQLQRSAKTGNKTEKTYYLDGVEVTDAQFKEIEMWLPNSEKKQSSSQVEAGINSEFERKYMVVALANIESIEQGDFKYNIVKAETNAENLAEVTR